MRNLVDVVIESGFVANSKGGNGNSFEFATWQEAYDFHKLLSDGGIDFKTPGCVYWDQQGKFVSLRFESYVESNAFGREIMDRLIDEIMPV